MMKYIRHENYGMILFSNALTHKVVARSIGDTEGLISAGLVWDDPDAGLQCFGSSESLGIEANPSDTKLLRLQMGPR